VSGMLCCISRSATHTLDAVSVQVLEMLAKVVAEDRAARAEQARRGNAERDRVRRILDDPDTLASVFQPIVELASGRLVAHELLTRFADGTPPDLMFSLAARAGLGAELEQVAIARALAEIRRVGVATPVWVNVSPAALRSSRLRSTLLDFDPAQLVVEITEHAVVDSYETLSEDLAPLRERGVRIAVDDAGAGFASMQHVLRLRPDIIKLDGGLIRGIAGDPVRQALTSSLVSFGRSIGSQILAEAVETPSELNTLHRLGVELAQGFLLARPGALPGPASFPTPTSTGRVSASDWLTRIAVALHDAPDLESLVRPLLDAVVDLTEMDTAYLAVLGDDGMLEQRYVHNAGPIQLPEGGVSPWEDSLCRRCAELGILWTDRVPIDLLGVPLAEPLRLLQTYLSVPLADADGSLLGTLCAGSTRSLFVPDHVIAQVCLCAHLVATRMAAAPSAGLAEVCSPVIPAP